MRLILFGGLALAMALFGTVAGAAPDATAQPKTSPPMPRLLQPATGYWYDAERPGTGFALQRRDATLALVFFHFSDVPDDEARTDDWHLATGTLDHDTFEAPLLHFDGGSCLGCTPFTAAATEQTGTVVRLVFTSAREAMLAVGDAEPRRVVAMPYGVGYDSHPATPADLPLPDLRGRWLVGLRDPRFAGVFAFALHERAVVEDGEGMVEGMIEYRGPAYGVDRANAAMRCDGQQCALWLDSLPELSPEPQFLASFRIGDITEERMTGDGPLFHVRAFRLHDTEVQP